MVQAAWIARMQQAKPHQLGHYLALRKRVLRVRPQERPGMVRFLGREVAESRKEAREKQLALVGAAHALHEQRHIDDVLELLDAQHLVMVQRLPVEAACANGCDKTVEDMPRCLGELRTRRRADDDELRAAGHQLGQADRVHAVRRYDHMLQQNATLPKQLVEHPSFAVGAHGARTLGGTTKRHFPVQLNFGP